MTLDVLLAGAGVLGVAVAALSGRLRRLPLSEPFLGLVVGVALGPVGLGALTIQALTAEHGWLHEGARALLAISVMAVALRYPIRDLRPLLPSLVLLLAVVMPAMALVTTGVAWATLGVGWGAALLLGAALCPTDPVLASSVVTGEPAERDLPSHDRRLLSVESDHAATRTT